MRIYYFPQSGSWHRLGASPEELQRILERIAADTDTADLVVAVHLVRHSRWSGGTAYVRQWLQPSSFYAKRGRWRLEEAWSAPAELPARYKLIRLLVPDNGSAYPLTETDRYGWQHIFSSSKDHLAFFFAHELHHFRRYHLSLHAGEGEHSANAWAAEHCQRLGFTVKSTRLRRRKKTKRGRAQPGFWQVMNPADFLPAAHAGTLWKKGGMLVHLAARLGCRNQEQYVQAKLRHIQQLGKSSPGARVWITFDPQRKYLHAPARLVRQLRRPSLRVVIETEDGRIWRWPMAWLSSEPPEP